MKQKLLKLLADLRFAIVILLLISFVSIMDFCDWKDFREKSTGHNFFIF